MFMQNVVMSLRVAFDLSNDVSRSKTLRV